MHTVGMEMNAKLPDRTMIVGVLNVTPDSYVPESRATTVNDAVARAGQMLQDGADIIEIGGESTGPGSKDVRLDDELSRVIPVIQAIRKAYPDAVLSLDTYKAAVAREGLEEGVTIINDVTAGRGDADLFKVVADAGAFLVLMYAKDAGPRTTVREDRYGDVIATITKFLSGRKGVAEAAGVPSAKIILDPGLGHFVSSDPAYSFEILARLRELRALGCPLLVSPSRKSFLAGSEQLPVKDRLPGTVAASAIAVLNGADYVRTHDVPEIRRAVEIAGSIRRAGGSL